MSDSLSTKAQAFLADLEELCRTHRVQLSFNDEAIVELWPLDPDDEPVMFETIDDNLDVPDDDVDVEVEPDVDEEPAED